MSKIYDFIGIGLGPFNLSLACLTQPIDTLDGLFLEQKSEFNWHPGMMLDGVSLQTPFMSDLVTLADPTSPLSFLNYAKQQGRLYQFYIKESFFLLREEYNRYCQWACSQLNNLRFNHYVKSVQFLADQDCYQLDVSHQGQDSCFYARKLVLGTGPVPNYTPAVEGPSAHVLHSGDYMHQREELLNSKTITVVGSGQSAAEIYYDLLQQIDEHDYQLNWLTRAHRFFPLEYTKLTLEMTSPEYVDHFYNMSQSRKDKLITEQTNLYKGINSSLINEIYDLLYEKSVRGPVNTRLMTHCELQSHTQQTLVFKHRETQQPFSFESEKLIMCTGYRANLPSFLEGLNPHINWDQQGRFAVDRHYSIEKQQRIFVQNAEIHTHGFVTPDLGMACYRNSHIIKQLCGKEIYPIESRIAFQAFSPPKEWQINQVNLAETHSL